MMILFQIGTVVPLYFFFVVAVIAAALAWFLYRKSVIEPKIVRNVLMLLRFTGLFVVFVLLLSPVIKFSTVEYKKPLLLLYTDVSLSVDTVKDKTAILDLHASAKKLSQKFEIRFYNFASTVSADSVVSLGSTNLSAVFDHANEISLSRNTAAVLLATDGIYNVGVNPTFKNSLKSTPFFILGLGDTTQYPDIRVQSVQSNTSVFLGNEFSIECVLRSVGVANKSIRIQLLENGKEIQSQKWNVQNNTGLGKFEFVVKPTQIGKVKYDIKAEAILEEINTTNNNGFVYVDVTDTRRKIAIVSHSPNPDIAAITRSLKLRSEYEITQFMSPRFPAIEMFDLIVTHGLPSTQSESVFLKKLLESQKPTWQIWSLQVVPSLFSFSDLGFQLSAAPGSLNEVQAAVNTDFHEFALDPEWVALLPDLPPLKSLYGNFRAGPGVIKMFNQKIGAVPTQFPLMSFVQEGNSRHAFLFGEGLWKWRLKTYEKTGEFVNFDDWIAQITQFVTTNEKSKRFSTSTQQSVFESGDNIVIAAEYLDKNLKPDNSSDCSVELTGDNGFKKKLPFSKVQNQYRVDAGVLPSGEYTFVSSRNGAERLTDAGRFTVLSAEMERKNTVADHQLLRTISNKNGGVFKNKNALPALLDSIEKKVSSKPILIEKEKTAEPIHIKWLLFLLVLIFGAEWFLRRWAGSY